VSRGVQPGSPLLTVEDLRVSYDQVQALKGVTISLEAGEIVTVLGANGAGKSTLLSAITGLVGPTSGSVRLQGEPLLGLPAHDVVRRGVSLAPEGRRVFATLSVDENLSLGAFTIRGERSAVERARERVFDLFAILRRRRHQLAGTLSGGEQQMLAIGRALMTTPRLLLLDEPSLGLAPIFVGHIFDIIREINRGGTAVLLVEQNASKALAVAARAYVLETGRVTMSGPAAELRADPRVQAAYLGGRALERRRAAAAGGQGGGGLDPGGAPPAG
jgi:branched-chain amino acid transport system ATP-binding protein